MEGKEASLRDHLGIDSWRIPGLLKKLYNTFPRCNVDWPVDVLLATNMISAGVGYFDGLGIAHIERFPVRGAPENVNDGVLL